MLKTSTISIHISDLHSLKQGKPFEPIKLSEPSKHWHVYPVPLVMQVPSPHQTRPQAAI